MKAVTTTDWPSVPVCFDRQDAGGDRRKGMDAHESGAHMRHRLHVAEKRRGGCPQGENRGLKHPVAFAFFLVDTKPFAKGTSRSLLLRLCCACVESRNTTPRALPGCVSSVVVGVAEGGSTPVLRPCRNLAPIVSVSNRKQVRGAACLVRVLGLMDPPQLCPRIPHVVVGCTYLPPYLHPLERCKTSNSNTSPQYRPGTRSLRIFWRDFVLRP